MIESHLDRVLLAARTEKSTSYLENVMLSAGVDDAVMLSILKHIRTHEGAVKYGGQIGDTITSDAAPQIKSSHIRGVNFPVRLGYRLSDQPTGFSAHLLPFGSKIRARSGDKRMFTKFPDGQWHEDIGTETFDNAFISGLEDFLTLQYIPGGDHPHPHTEPIRTHVGHAKHYTWPVVMNSLYLLAAKLVGLDSVGNDQGLDDKMTRKDLVETAFRSWVLRMPEHGGFEANLVEGLGFDNGSK